MTKNPHSPEFYDWETTDFHFYSTAEELLRDTKIRRHLKKIWKRKYLNSRVASQCMSDFFDDSFPKLPPDARFCFDPEFHRIVAFIPSRSKHSVALINAELLPAALGATEFDISTNQSVHPPAHAKFLLLLIPRKHREHLLGDLEEEYRLTVLPEYGPFKAKAWYWWQVVISIGVLMAARAAKIINALETLSKFLH